MHLFCAVKIYTRRCKPIFAWGNCYQLVSVSIFFFLQVLCSSFVCTITVTNISVLFFPWLFFGSHLSGGSTPCYVWACWMLLVYKAGLAQTTIQYVDVDHVDGPHAPWYLNGGLRSFLFSSSESPPPFTDSGDPSPLEISFTFYSLFPNSYLHLYACQTTTCLLSFSPCLRLL